jgi:hypothetical protein
MNVASAADFPSDEFETEILLSKNALVFLHGQDPERPWHLRSSARLSRPNVPAFDRIEQVGRIFG